jgi:hypothetical protein
MEHKSEHFDPPRYPKLILPIEEAMKIEFKVTCKKIMIDLTKQLVKEIKSK